MTALSLVRHPAAATSTAHEKVSADLTATWLRRFLKRNAASNAIKRLEPLIKIVFTVMNILQYNQSIISKTYVDFYLFDSKLLQRFSGCVYSSKKMSNSAAIEQVSSLDFM